MNKSRERKREGLSFLSKERRPEKKVQKEKKKKKLTRQLGQDRGLTHRLLSLESERGLGGAVKSAQRGAVGVEGGVVVVDKGLFFFERDEFIFPRLSFFFRSPVFDARFSSRERSNWISRALDETTASRLVFRGEEERDVRRELQEGEEREEKPIR